MPIPTSVQAQYLHFINEMYHEASVWGLFLWNLLLESFLPVSPILPIFLSETCSFLTSEETSIDLVFRLTKADHLQHTYREQPVWAVSLSIHAPAHSSPTTMKPIDMTMMLSLQHAPHYENDQCNNDVITQMCARLPAAFF